MKEKKEKKKTAKDTNVICPNCSAAVSIPTAMRERNCSECGTLVRR